jgi:cell division protein FtsB
MISNIKRKENEKRKRNRETRWMKYLISSLIIILLLLFTMGCKGVKHVLQIEEPTDHTQGDDGGKLKYKIIWGDINQKE